MAYYYPSRNELKASLYVDCITHKIKVYLLCEKRLSRLCRNFFIAVTRKKEAVLEQAPAYGQSGHYNCHHTHQFDKDIQARAGGVLEGVAHGIANNGGLV